MNEILSCKNDVLEYRSSNLDSFGVLDFVLEAYFSSYCAPHMNLLFKTHKPTHLHSLHVACVSVQLGAALGLNGEQLLALSAGALLHDIGKQDVPLEILNKPGKLTGKEYALIKLHPLASYQRMQECGVEHPDIVSKICLLHHVYADGTGYPNQKELKVNFPEIDSENLPLEVRIVTVADVFCALVSPRSYKKPYSYMRAIHMLKRLCPSLSEEIIDVLIMLIRGNRLLLNTEGDVTLSLQ